MLPGMMRTKVAGAALLLTTTIIALAPAPQAAQLQPGVTAIRAGRLIDPDAGTAAADQVILIAGGRITAVGRDVAIPAGATVIDLSKARSEERRVGKEWRSRVRADH